MQQMQQQQMPGQMQQMQSMGGMPRNSPLSSVPQSPHMVPQSPLSQHGGGGMAPSPMSQHHMSPHPGMSPATTHTPTHNPSSRDEFNLGEHA
jgi:hypothetical protein